MADSKTTALTAATSLSSGDLLYAVIDPAGTPLSRKITVDNLFGAIPSTVPLGWSDAPWRREAAGVIALRDSATPRDGVLRLYNDNGTWDAATNYERGFARWNGNVFEFGTENGGTGTLRNARITAPTISLVTSSRTIEFQSNTFYPTAATVDLGWGGFFPFRDLFLRPSSSLTPASNGDLCIEATNNTTLTFRYKGSDATVRSGTITLA